MPSNCRGVFCGKMVGKVAKQHTSRFRGLSLYKKCRDFFSYIFEILIKGGFFFQNKTLKTKLPLTFQKWTKIKMSKMDFYEIIFFFEK
jgi:hypothetical protein